MMKKDNKNKELKFKGVEVIILIVATGIISFAGAMLVIIRFNLAKTSDDNSVDKELKEFSNAYNNIINSYYGNIDKEKLVESAITGMLESIGDKNTASIDESQSNNFNAYLKGSYEGIGVEIVSDTSGNIIVYSVFQDSPASKAGLEPGDTLKKVNGIEVKDKTTQEVVSLIKHGDASIKIEIEREEKAVNLEINRTSIILDSVASEVYEKNGKKIGYIYISVFAENTYKQFEQKLNELESQNIQSLIIDVRGNSGGHLTSAADILSLFLNSDKVIYQTEDNSGIKKFYSTGTETKTYPIVVLADSQSASASEILASGLKEQYGAKMVGEKTYGKGTVQKLVTTSTGFQYKVTIQHWLTSNGIWINEKGIEPDYVVKLDEEYYNKLTFEADNQLQYAIKIISEN